MTKAEYIEGDRFAGVSLGLEYNYRYTRHKGRVVIYDIRDGKIIEYVDDRGNDVLTEDIARERLRELNGIKEIITDEIRDALDTEN